MVLLDENVDNRLRSVLESQGFEVSTTFEEALSGFSDREIIEYAIDESMIIFTHDDDFLSIVSELDQHPSIMYIPQKTGFRQMKERVRKVKEHRLKSQEISIFCKGTGWNQKNSYEIGLQ